MGITIIIFALFQFVAGAIGIAVSIESPLTNLVLIGVSVFFIANGWVYLVVVELLESGKEVSTQS